MSEEAKTQEPQLSEGEGQKQAQSSNTKVVKKEKTTKKKTLATHLKEISKLFIANPLKITVMKCQTVYRTIENSPTDAIPQYNILFANYSGSITEKYAIRTDITKNADTRELYLKPISEKKASKWLNYEKDVKRLMTELKYPDIKKQITPFDYKKMLNVFSENPELWKKALSWLVDDTGQRDERLILIGLAGVLPIPMQYRKGYQHHNCHSLIFTNAGTGKSGVFNNLLGEVGSSAFSETGLVGGGNKGNETSGTLNGIGQKPLEEVTGGIKKNDDFVPPMEYLLDYMNDGRKKRDIASQPECLGTKNIAFIGNIIDAQNDFRHIISRIAYTRDNDKHGRRLVLFLIDDDVKKMPEEIELTELEQHFKECLREVLNVFIAENINNIWKNFIITQRKLWCTIDNDYKQKILDLSTKTTDDTGSKLLSGHSGKSPALRLTALRIFIMYHLVDIITNKIKRIDAKYINEYNEIYDKLKNMNILSLENIVGSDEKMQELLHYLTEKALKDDDLQRIPIETNQEIQQRLNLGERQVRRILKRYLNMRKGIRRT